jgi:hypothetical protein
MVKQGVVATHARDQVRKLFLADCGFIVAAGDRKKLDERS